MPPCPNSYFVYGPICRLTAKYSRVVASQQTGGQLDGTNRVFAAALKSPAGNFTWIIVNDAPRPWSAALSLNGCQRSVLYTYQVSEKAKNQPELKINPMRAAAVKAGNVAFRQQLPPLSITVISTMKLGHSVRGIIEDND